MIEVFRTQIEIQIQKNISISIFFKRQDWKE